MNPEVTLLLTRKVVSVLLTIEESIAGVERVAKSGSGEVEAGRQGFLVSLNG